MAAGCGGKGLWGLQGRFKRVGPTSHFSRMTSFSQFRVTLISPTECARRGTVQPGFLFVCKFGIKSTFSDKIYVT